MCGIIILINNEDYFFYMGQVDEEYKKLVQRVLWYGEDREDRTGVGTRSLFGLQMNPIDLRLGFPLLTTKKINIQAVWAELFWFLSGSTNINDLPIEFQFIWKPWSWNNGQSKGIYHNFVNWWTYDDFGGHSVNQIDLLIKRLKKNPNSRRHLVSAWNVDEIEPERVEMPPCHTFFQCYVSQEKYLDLKLYARSQDLPIGTPFNIASYATLMHMLGWECNLIPRYYIHSCGDAHIYLNQLDLITEQLQREPKKSPTIKHNMEKFDFWKCKRENLILENYEHHPFIKYPVAV